MIYSPMMLRSYRSKVSCRKSNVEGRMRTYLRYRSIPDTTFILKDVSCALLSSYDCKV